MSKGYLVALLWLLKSLWFVASVVLVYRLAVAAGWL